MILAAVILLIIFLFAKSSNGLAHSESASTQHDSMIVEGWKNGVAYDLTVTSIGDGFYLAVDAAAAFKSMRAAASGDGVSLIVNSAWRSFAKQTELRNLYLAGRGYPADVPGYSQHQQGLSVDIAVGGTYDTVTYLWLQSNAGRFGFRNNAAGEPHHWTYGG